MFLNAIRLILAPGEGAQDGVIIHIRDQDENECE